MRAPGRTPPPLIEPSGDEDTFGDSDCVLFGYLALVARHHVVDVDRVDLPIVLLEPVCDFGAFFLVPESGKLWHVISALDHGVRGVRHRKS